MFARIRYFLKSVWWEMTYNPSAEFGYLRALDDVFDHALDRNNPEHDSVRRWIQDRRKEIHEKW